MIPRRIILPLLFALAVADLAAQTPTPAPQPTPLPALEWHDVTQWGVEGRVWPDLERERWFDRLPASAQGKVTPKVWDLSRDSAGMMVRFKTDATTIGAHYVLRSEHLANPNMTAIGASGIDLYARDESGKWRWVGNTKPEKKEVKQALIGGLAPGWREYAAYLPLYNGIETLAIGVPPGAKFEGLPPRAEKPIVFYGTSITHGASASRPGMVHTAILGRRFDRPVVNLGFSGNGKMDAAVGEFLAKIDAAVFVIDCLPNMGPPEVRAKCPPLVRQLKAARPETPVVLVEDRRWGNTWIRPERQKFHDENHAALRECFDSLKKEGVTKLYYIPGDALIGDDAEGSTDGSHPNDLGFVRQAAIFEPVLREALAGS
ncbi:MAG TPA: SGNH/GDSL hydrolase family protein [Chthoniobacteraceae bacterium]|nr:SGNH/GDSL hydrolase family protein [Chthoniobacteraceae bacterium]